MNSDGRRTYRPPDSDRAQTLRLGLVSVVQYHSHKADGIYYPDAFEVPGRERARVVFARDDAETTVCWLRLDHPGGPDFWTTPKMRALHAPIIADIEQLGFEQIVVGQMVRPTCPNCKGKGATPHVFVDYIDVVVAAFSNTGTVLDICPTCVGQGVLS